MGSKIPISVSYYDLNYFLAKEGLTVEDCTKEQIENVIACNDDVEHVQDLMNMSRLSNNTLEIAQHIEKHTEKQEGI